jgi:FkbM family methyltransferase
MSVQEKMLQFYSQFIQKGSLCFDVGANVGNRTGIFLRLGAKVIAVEPQPPCMQILKNTFGGADVVFIQKALGESEGVAEFYTSNVDAISSLSKEWISSVKKSGRFSMYQWDSGTLVQVTTMDALISQYGLPTFCKIDVEGYEFQVLRGLSKPIPAVSFEFTPEYLDSAISCIRHLSRLAPYRFNYSLLESMELALPQPVESKEIIRLLTHLPEKWVFGDVYAQIRA